MFSDWIRRTGFWIVDYLKGGKIHKNYLDINKEWKMKT